MACDCIVSECIKVYVSACDTGVFVGLTAPDDGDYLVRLKFNGAYKELTLSLETGDDIILPNIVNGDYTHEMQIYLPDGSLMNDTCYSLRVSTVIAESNGLTPSPSADPYSRVITITDEMITDGSTITYSLFSGKVINEIDTENQAYLVGVGFSQSGDTITWLNGMISFVGQVIKVSW
jgi:hypothetical protein